MDQQEPQVPADDITSASVEKMSEVDVLVLELAKTRRLAAQSEVKAAVAQSEKAELAFRYLVLQLYRKYDLTDQDGLSEDGQIVRNGTTLPKEGQ